MGSAQSAAQARLNTLENANMTPAESKARLAALDAATNAILEDMRLATERIKKLEESEQQLKIALEKASRVDSAGRAPSEQDEQQLQDSLMTISMLKERYNDIVNVGEEIKQSPRSSPRSSPRRYPLITRSRLSPPASPRSISPPLSPRRMTIVKPGSPM